MPVGYNATDEGDVERRYVVFLIIAKSTLTEGPGGLFYFGESSLILEADFVGYYKLPAVVLDGGRLLHAIGVPPFLRHEGIRGADGLTLSHSYFEL